MEDKIQNKNRIPGGCDKLTQPYEIKALSKYLKSIKKAQEDSIELEKNNLEMSPTGPIQIDELPDGSLGLENYLDNIDSLPEDSLKLEDINEIDSLSTDSLKIEDLRNLESLPDSRLGLEDANQEYTELPQDKTLLEKEEDTLELENTRLDLGIESETTLEDAQLDIPGEINDPELSQSLQRMVGDILEKTALESKVEKVPDQIGDVDLEKDLIRLEGTEKELSLKSTLQKLEGTEIDIELGGNKIEKLDSGDEIIELENSIDTLSDIKEITSLSDEIKKIEAEDVDKLENSKSKIPGKIEEQELSKKKEKLSDNRKPVLDKSKEKIIGKVKEVSKLEKNKSKLSDKRVPKLEKGKPVKLDDTKKDLRLEKTRQEIPDKNEDISELEDTLLKVTEEFLEEPELEDKIYTLDDVLFESELPSESISLYDLEGVIPDQNELPSSKVGIIGTVEEPKLDDSKDKLETDIKYINEDEYGEEIKNIPNRTEKFGDRPSYSKFLSDPSKFVVRRPIGESNKLQDNPEDQDEVYNSNKDFKSTRTKEGIQDIRDIPNNFSERLQYTIDELKKEGEWGKRIAAYLSVILNRSSDFTDDIPQADVNKFEALLTKTISANSKLSSKVKQYMPAYSLPHFSMETLNPSAWLRSVAELTVGLAKNIHGKSKALLIDEALGLLILGREKLEEITEASKHRLPGDASPFSAVLSGGSLTGAVANTVGAMAGTPLEYPVNRPMKDGRNPVNKNDIIEKTVEPSQTIMLGGGIEENRDLDVPGKTVTKKTEEEETSWQDILGRTEKSKIVEGDDKKTRKAADSKERNTKLGKALQKVGNAIGGKKKRGDYSFSNYYIQNSKGVQQTIEELVGSDVNVKSVETFFHDLETSPYMTTQSKITGTSNQYKVSTLDSNSYWEIKLYPYFGADNGNTTFLPDFGEINENNKRLFGIDTAYSQWIPITSFELQKKKLTQKTLGLYDGEISYPVSMEFLNEFRITIMDDAYKSWKTYFQKCAEVAIFYSQARTLGEKDSNTRTRKMTYEDGVNTFEENQEVYSTILQDQYLVAMYKNITFRCELYVMTPQLATVIKYDLLLVMKDFQEEYSGDAADSPAADLTISFSIVGENPEEDPIKPVPVALEPQVSSKKGADYATIANQALNKGMGLLK